MPILKVTLFFEGNQKGWTESYWRPGAGDDHENQLAVVRELAAKRAKLLGRECKIKAFRISTEGIGPDALLKYEEFPKPRVPDGNGKLPALAPHAAQPDVALQVRANNIGNTKHKFVFMRGIWDVVEDEHGRYRPNEDWNKAFAEFRAHVEANDWGWFGVSSKTKSRLVSATRDVKDQVTFVFQEDLFPAGLVEGNKRTRVRISGVNNGKSNLNRTHIVKVVDRKTAVTEFTTSVGNIIVGGFGAHQVYDFIDIRSLDDQKIVTRECGAPLLESPGRQKAKNRA